jgi:glycosyltransferase involved in cell wall biosynthesis
LDSYSTDDTLSILEKYPVSIYQNKFLNFAQQRNFGLDNINFEHDWILHLDADEVVTEELRLEIEQLSAVAKYDGYFLASKTILFGKWLKYSSGYPVYQARLGRKNDFRFMQVGHGQRENIKIEKMGKLNQAYLHYSFSKGMAEWFAKHNYYSTDEALLEFKSALETINISDFISTTSVKRRRILKTFSKKLWFRPLFRFLYIFVIKFGFLDGMIGLRYCILMAIYEYMIEIKKKELVFEASVGIRHTKGERSI